MDKISINGKDRRYLSELPEFKDGLPHGVVNKTEADRGGTYVAANCPADYIIVCPYRDLVDSIEADINNKYKVFKCYGGIQESYFHTYCKKHKTKKIAVTYDSLPKLIKWISHEENNCKLTDFKVLVDEYHLILEDLDFKHDAITGLMNQIKQFKHYTFLSATPIGTNFEIDFFKHLPHYEVTWENKLKITPYRFKVTGDVVAATTALIREFLSDNGIALPNIDDIKTPVEQLFIFMNSVTSIEQICRTMDLDPDDVKICCAEKQRNRKILNGKYDIEPVCNPNKRINFFTKKGFQGCNLFTNNGLIVVVSDGRRGHTLVDISTTMKQIAGRLRENAETSNCFRHIIMHIYNTNSHIIDDEQFEAIMKEKRQDAEALKDMVKGYSEDQMKLWASRTNLDDDLVSVVNGKLVDNPLKEQYFRYKQHLRQSYKDGYALRNAYAASDKFEVTNQHTIEALDIIMRPKRTVSYQDLIRDYWESPNDQYEKEYPEFKEYKKYLTLEQMHSMGWKKEKLMQRAEDKKKLCDVFLAIHAEGFISNKELKQRFAEEFQKRGISLAPKATLIKECELYNVTQKRGGYELGAVKMESFLGRGRKQF